MHLKSGTILQGGKYRIEKTLGQGGFSNTYLAVQVAAERTVAVKEFYMKEYCDRDELSSQVIVPTKGTRQIVDRYRQKFLKEAQMIASLKNEYIIQIYDIFEENGTAYYVMEYVSAGSLKDKVEQNGPMTENQALAYICQVSSALTYLHTQNILHLDVKPSNILIDSKNRAVLIDFGISKHYDSDGGQTSTTPVGISKGFAPIEQYQQGGLSGFSPSTDVYSLGATLYYLISGQIPPDASVVYEDGLPPLEEKYSASVWEAINKAMSPRRKDRHQSVEDFINSLSVGGGCSQTQQQNDCKQNDETDGEETILNEEASIIKQAAPAKPSRKVSVTLLAFFAILLLAGVLFFMVSGRVGEDAEDDLSAEVVPELLLDGKKSMTIQVSSSGGKCAVIPITKNFSGRWTYTGRPDWCRFVADSSSLSITVDENKTSKNREAKILFSHSLDTTLAELTIIQKAKVEQKKEPVAPVVPAVQTVPVQTSPPPVQPVKVSTQANAAPTETAATTEAGQTEIVEVADCEAAGNETEDIRIEEEIVEEEPIPFQLVEEKPSFQGGDANEFSKWVNKRLEYPEIAKENGIQGRVTLQFTIAPDGSLKNVKVLRSVEPSLDREAVRVVSMSPKWKPGKQRGRLVPVSYTFPVIFQLR